MVSGWLTGTSPQIVKSIDVKAYYRKCSNNALIAKKEKFWRLTVMNLFSQVFRAYLGVNMKSRRATKIPRPYGPCNH